MVHNLPYLYLRLSIKIKKDRPLYAINSGACSGTVPFPPTANLCQDTANEAAMFMDCMVEAPAYTLTMTRAHSS